MKPVTATTVAALVLCLVSVGCARSRGRGASFRGMQIPTPTPETKRVGLGTACYVQSRNRYGIVTYRVNDVGRSGVPKLAVDDRETLARIKHNVVSDTLRFASAGTEFAVFNAQNGPCDEYRVLNLSCNTGFDGRDQLEGTTAFPGPCLNTARPWMPQDNVEGTVPWARVFGVTPRKNGPVH